MSYTIKEPRKVTGYHGEESYECEAVTSSGVFILRGYGATGTIAYNDASTQIASKRREWEEKQRWIRIYDEAFKN